MGADGVAGVLTPTSQAHRQSAGCEPCSLQTGSASAPPAAQVRRVWLGVTPCTREQAAPKRLVAGEVGGVPAEADRPFRGVHLSQRGVGDTRLTGVELEDVNGHGPTSTGGRAAGARGWTSVPPR